MSRTDISTVETLRRRGLAVGVTDLVAAFGEADGLVGDQGHYEPGGDAECDERVRLVGEGNEDEQPGGRYATAP